MESREYYKIENSTKIYFMVELLVEMIHVMINFLNVYNIELLFKVIFCQINMITNCLVSWLSFAKFVATTIKYVCSMKSTHD